MKAYLVVGSCNDRADCDEKWMVASYDDRGCAELHFEKCIEWTNSNLQNYDRPAWQATKIKDNPWDVDMLASRYGTTYEVVEVGHYQHPDQYLEAHETNRSRR